MKTFKKIAWLLLLLGAAGCAGHVDGPRGYCTVPPADECMTEGESPFWGSGPNTYCPTEDGTEWHIDPNGGTRYVKVGGTNHSAGHVVCVTAPDGRVVFGEGSGDVRR